MYTAVLLKLDLQQTTRDIFTQAAPSSVYKLVALCATKAICCGCTFLVVTKEGLRIHFHDKYELVYLKSYQLPLENIYWPTKWAIQ